VDNSILSSSSTVDLAKLEFAEIFSDTEVVALESQGEVEAYLVSPAGMDVLMSYFLSASNIDEPNSDSAYVGALLQERLTPKGY
jgi:hypothetical protein